MKTKQILNSVVGVMVGIWAAASLQAAGQQSDQNTLTNKVITVSETSSSYALFSYANTPEYTAYRAVRFSKTILDDWLFLKDTEYGDEIVLDNGGRGFNALTKFVLEYWNNFTPRSDRTVTLRIYAMDGAPSPGSYGNPTPGTLLYESTQLLDPSGTLVFDLTNNGQPLYAPDDIAWTVQFQGPLTEYQTGLWIADEVQIGSSYSDFWIYDPQQGWSLYQFANGQPANFAATVLAVPEPSTIALFLIGFGGIAWIARKRR